MTRREWLAGVSAVAFAKPDVRPQQPNIVFFLADDLGYGDVGFLNKHSRIPTPNLDRLASQGVYGTDAHDPTAVCTPTRYSILTGRYCWRSRLKKGVLVQYDPPLIEATRQTLPGLLRQQGYATAAIGKWHLGFDWPSDFTQPVANGPVTRGFDYFFGMDAPNYPPYVYIENDRLQGNPTSHFAGGGMDNGIDSRPGPALPGWKQEDVLPRMTSRAVEYIQASQGRQKPFFLYFACMGPHTPIVPAKEFQGKTAIGPYGDYVNQVDASLGQLLDALDRSGQAGNTLVIFTSDNGPELFAYERARQYGHYSMGPWRGIKRDAWEGGHRVPLIARWPGHIKPGTSTSETICQTDWLATLAAIAGAKLSNPEDSFNILPALQGRKLRNKPPTILHSHQGHFAIREGPWVLIDYKTGDNNKEPEWFRKERGYQPHNLAGELYHLGKDPAQKHNLYAENPKIVRRLKLHLEAAKAKT